MLNQKRKLLQDKKQKSIVGQSLNSENIDNPLALYPKKFIRIDERNAFNEETHNENLIHFQQTRKLIFINKTIGIFIQKKNIYNKYKCSSHNY